MEDLPSRKLKSLFAKFRFSIKCVGADILDPNYKPSFLTYSMIGLSAIYGALVVYTIKILFREDWKIILELLTVSGNVFQGMAKLFTGILLSKRLRNICLKIEEIYNNFEKISLAYEKILHKSLRRYNIAIILNIFGYFSTMMTMWLFPLFYYIVYKRKLLPFKFLIPGVDPDTYTGYIMHYILHSLCIGFGGLGNLAGDSCFIILVLSTCLMADIFKQKVIDFNVKLRENDNNQRVDIKELAAWLYETNTFSKRVIESFYWVIAVEIFSCAMATIINIFTMTNTDWPAAYPNTLVNLMFLYTYCILGTISESSADDLIETVYEIEWYHLKIVDQKIVRFMLMISQNKIVFTVVGLAPLSVNTALQVTKTIYSYWMILSSFVE